MALQHHTIPLTGGHDRSTTPLIANPSSFYALHDLRQNPDTPGRIEQTHPFYVDRIIPARAGEPSTSTIRRIIRPAKLTTGYITFSDYAIYNTQLEAHVPVVYFHYFPLSPPPNLPDVNTQLHLTFDTLFPSALFLNTSIIIEVLSSTTFRYKFSTELLWSGTFTFSTAGTDIGGMTVYSLVNSGFSPGDSFHWTRSDSITDSGAPGDILDMVQYKDEVYYINSDHQVMKLVHSTGGQYYSVSAGYEYLYANYLAIFEDHLFLLGGGPVDENPEPPDVANSDLGDLDAFEPTDVNEADRFVIPVNTTFPFAENEITGGGVVNSRLFVTTESGIWYTDYLGLPIPFSFKRLRDFPGIIRVMTGLDCLYFYTNDGRLYRFDGTSITSYGANYFPLLTSTTDIWDVTIDRKDLVQYFFDIGNRTLLANDHSRSLDFPGGAPGCVANLGDALYVGTANLLVLKEDRLLNHTPVPVSSTPHLITQPIIGNAVFSAKESNGVYLAVDLSTPRGPAYAINDGLRVLVDYFNTDTGIPITLITGGVWDTTVPQNFVDVRTAFKSLLVRLAVVSASALPPAGVAFTSLVLEGSNLNKTEPIKK